MNGREFADRVLLCERKLFRIAYLSLNSYADCEDVVQDALLKAWRARHSLREARYFDTWLVRILLNEVKALYRRRRGRVLEPLPDDLPAPEPADAEVRDAVRRLDAKLRAPLLLHHLEGYTIDETASILGISPRSARWRLEQGRKRLREALGEEGES